MQTGGVLITIFKAGLKGLQGSSRGKVLKLVTEFDDLTIGDIAERTGKEPEQIIPIVRALEKEGFLVTEADSVRLG